MTCLGCHDLVTPHWKLPEVTWLSSFTCMETQELIHMNIVRLTTTGIIVENMPFAHIGIFHNFHKVHVWEGSLMPFLHLNLSHLTLQPPSCTLFHHVAYVVLLILMEWQASWALLKLFLLPGILFYLEYLSCLVLRLTWNISSSTELFQINIPKYWWFDLCPH